MKRLLYILFLLFLLAACRENKKEQFARLVQEWQGKEIVFPQDMVFTRFVTEQVEYRIPDAEYKVLIYVDSTGCTSCKLQLPKWKELIAHVDSATNGSIPVSYTHLPVLFLPGRTTGERRQVRDSYAGRSALGPACGFVCRPHGTASSIRVRLCLGFHRIISLLVRILRHWSLRGRSSPSR